MTAYTTEEGTAVALVARVLDGVITQNTIVFLTTSDETATSKNHGMRDNYRNPRCACAPRVNHGMRSVELLPPLQTLHITLSNTFMSRKCHTLPLN